MASEKFTHAGATQKIALWISIEFFRRNRTVLQYGIDIGHSASPDEIRTYSINPGTFYGIDSAAFKASTRPSRVAPAGRTRGIRSETFLLCRPMPV
jgi:hypothetical protein